MKARSSTTIRLLLFAVAATSVLACSADRIPGIQRLDGLSRANMTDDPIHEDQPPACADDPAECEPPPNEEGPVAEGGFYDASLAEPQQGLGLTEIGRIRGVSQADIRTGGGYWPETLHGFASTSILTGIGMAYLEGEGYFEGYFGSVQYFSPRGFMGTSWSSSASGDCNAHDLWVEVLSSHTGKFLTFGLYVFTRHSARCTRTGPGPGSGDPPREGCTFEGWIEVSYDGGRTWHKLTEVWLCPEEEM